MGRWLEIQCGISTVVIRILGFVFLRWIPGHDLPPIIYTLYALWLPSFITLLFQKPKYDLVGDEVDVTVLAAPENEPSDPVTFAKAVKEGTTARKRHGTTQQEEIEEAVSDMEEGGNSIDSNSKGLTKTGTIVLDAVETKTYKVHDPGLWQSLLFGLPSISAPKATLATVLVNTLLLAGTADLIYRSQKLYPASDLAFARVGHVTPTTAKILVRNPDETAKIWVSYRAEPENLSPLKSSEEKAWQSAGEYLKGISPDSDFTSIIQLSKLKPDTLYRYVTSANQTGTFQTAPVSGGSTFTFLTSSCIKANFPYSPLRHPLSVQGFNHLGKLLPSLKARFMLFLGDFIYIDAPHRPSGEPIEQYRQMYRQVYASPEWPKVGASLPWLHVLDDHEIANDFSPERDPRGIPTGQAGWSENYRAEVYSNATNAWNIYHASLNPPPVRKGASYYTFNYGGASFFMLDTRRYRSANWSPDGPEKSMLGREQLADVLKWIHQPSPPNIQWKILVSSVPFSKNWEFGNEDTWGGFRHERKSLLREMWKVRDAGVVVLSGDRHEFAATAFPPPRNESAEYSSTAMVYEFSCSPLNQFYLPTRTYKESLDGEDVKLAYIPDGNSKFGAVEIDSSNPDQGVLRYRLFIDGVEAWSRVITTPIDTSTRRLWT